MENNQSTTCTSDTEICDHKCEINNTCIHTYINRLDMYIYTDLYQQKPQNTGHCRKELAISSQ